MGLTRNGARTFLFIMQRACKMSHLPGFAIGLDTILGPGAGAEMLAVWAPVCIFVEELISQDSVFNKRDATLPDEDGSEDGPFG